MEDFVKDNEKHSEEKRKRSRSKKDKHKKDENKIKTKHKKKTEYENDFEEDEEDNNKKTKAVNDSEYIKNNYEDDFEEDSEENEEKLVEQVKSSQILQRLTSHKAPSLMIQKEETNERPTTRNIRRIPQMLNTNNQSIAPSPTSRIINFDNARTIDLESISSSASRYRKFKNLIGMESVIIVFDEIPPVKDYEFYMSMFGSRTKSQIGCQTGDDNKNISIMTEGLYNKENFWCQFPEFNQINNFGREGEGIIDEEIKKKKELDEELLEIFSKNRLKDKKLISLVNCIGKIVSKITELNETNSKQKDDTIFLDHKSDFIFTYGYNELDSQFYSENASVTALHYSTSSIPSTKSKSLFVAVKMEICKIDPKFNNKTFIIEYSGSHYQNVLNVFCAASEVTSLSTSPNNDMVLVAGTISGTILLFDLYENEKFFKSYKINFENNTKKYPIRMTCFDTSHESLDNEFIEINSPIISIHGFSSKLDTDSFSLISLNENGILTLWSIYKVSKQSIEMETNLGLLRPSSTIRMKKREILHPLKTIPSTVYSPTYVIANVMEIITPNKNSNEIMNESQINKKIVEERINILIATGNGCVLNTTASTLGIKKKSTLCKGLRLLTLINENTFEITSIKSSPFSEHIFVVGLCTGSLVIGSIYENNKKIILSPPEDLKLIVTSIEWSPFENGVIYSIHNYNHILIWNINISIHPIITTNLNDSIGGSNIKIWTTKCFIGNDNYAYLLFGLTNGRVQIHRLENILKNDDQKQNKNLDKIINVISF
uniref:WD_REPEATS_REGION domain-containing protein n=1 Tax=Strongyloides venezuelensis TaxID=75913 RepID=A0A0K0F925_STRVS